MKQSSYDKILEHAISAMSSNPTISMEALASKIGISRATLYRHFTNREQLLKAIIQESDKIYLSVITPILDEDISAKDKLEKFVRTYVPLCSGFYFLMYNDLFLSDTEIYDIYIKQNNTIKQLIKQMKIDSDIRADISEEWLVITIEFIIYGAWEGISKGDVAKNKAPEDIINLIFNGLSK